MSGVVPFQGQGILIAFHSCLFAVILVFLDATRVSVSNAPPPFFWPQLQVCSVGDALTHSTLLGLKMCWATMPPCSATTITLAALKIFLFLSVLLRCSPETPDRSQGYQSGQCPCTQSGRIFVFACLCVILMCQGLRPCSG